jgi:hypothetical protein
MLLRRMSPLRMFATLPLVPIGLVMVRLRVQVGARRGGQQAQRRAALPVNGPDGEAVLVNIQEEQAAAAAAAAAAPAAAAAAANNNNNNNGDNAAMRIANVLGPQSLSRLVVGALLLPYVSLNVGRLLFGAQMHPLDRTVFGGTGMDCFVCWHCVFTSCVFAGAGVAWVVAKGAFKYVYLRKRLAWLQRRRILNHVE